MFERYAKTRSVSRQEGVARRNFAHACFSVFPEQAAARRETTVETALTASSLESPAHPSFARDLLPLRNGLADV